MLPRKSGTGLETNLLARRKALGDRSPALKHWPVVWYYRVIVAIHGHAECQCRRVTRLQILQTVVRRPLENRCCQTTQAWSPACPGRTSWSRLGDDGACSGWCVSKGSCWDVEYKTAPLTKVSLEETSGKCGPSFPRSHKHVKDPPLAGEFTYIPLFYSP